MQALTAAEKKELHSGCMDKSFVLRRYIRVPDKIVLKTCNADHPGDNDWASMIHADLLKDGSNGKVQVILVFSGRFLLRSCTYCPQWAHRRLRLVDAASTDCLRP